VPTISLILPVYNGARYLREALDSVFAQSFTDFELIVVDDCSTDETPQILAEYAAREPRMQVLTNAVNSKLPASLNNGFRLARGEWFSWTSDDNILRPNQLERLLAVAQANPDCAIVHSDFTLIDEAGAEVEYIPVDPAEELVLGNAIGCSFLYKAEVDHALGGYDEDLFGLEDYDFWLRAARQFKFYTLHEDLYLYRRHPGSLTSARAKQIHAMAAKVMRREIDLLPAGAWRANAYVNLSCRDHYTIRLGPLFLALRDHPPTVFGQSGKIARWLRYAIKTRLLGIGAAAGVAGVLSAAWAD
jgi:glycosyltransferase involved in cell wall biosynthesis